MMLKFFIKIFILMPFPLIPIASAAMNAGGAVLNSLSAKAADNRSMNFSREMYERTKNDNIAFWQLQNEYNSPQAQMKRFEEAGLNKNLIYGQGNAGNAAAIQSPDVQTPSFTSREWGNGLTNGANFLNQMYDLDIKQAQADNLKAQNTVILQDALLKSAQVENLGANTARSKFDLGFEEGLMEISAEARKESLRQLKQNIDLSVRRDAREAAKNSSDISEALERMVNMREQNLNMKQSRQQTNLEMKRIRENINLLKQQGTLNDIEINMRKMGINPNDPMWTRILAQQLEGIIQKIEDWF